MNTPYDPRPRYLIGADTVDVGFHALARAVGRSRAATIAIDGPAAVDWMTLVDGLVAALTRAGYHPRSLDVRELLLPWPIVQRRSERPGLIDDPVFAAPSAVTLAELFASPPECRAAPREIVIIFGPGSGLASTDALWYAGLAKRIGLAAIQRGDAPNLGAPAGSSGSARRFLFVDAPLEATQRRSLAARWDRYIDVNDPERPCSVDGPALRRSIATLVDSPFRPRPSVIEQAWGGTWLRDVLGVEEGGRNTGLGYELVAPESGVLFGTSEADSIEVPLDVVVELRPEELLGGHVVERFGASFPIRFDYLDTVGGSDLSVHCHPLAPYMRDVFALPYTQHESYYVMATRPGSRIFLGLHEAADIAAFRREAERSQSDESPVDIERFVKSFDARLHQLYLIPAGTPHGSGTGNVVLEISATPYLYSLRFYDWLRPGLDGRPRAVQLGHAFANLMADRRGTTVARDLIQEPRVVRRGPEYVELDLGRHPELFFAVHRIDLTGTVDDATGDRFHVLNLVDGDAVIVQTARGAVHRLAYGETLIVPAQVGAYQIVGEPGQPVKLVKAFVA